MRYIVFSAALSALLLAATPGKADWIADAQIAFGGVGLVGVGIMAATMLGDEDVKQGVICDVKDTRVVSANAKACAAIGGKATHGFSIRKEEISASHDKAVVCEIKGEKVVSANARACQSIGGKATQAVVSETHEINSAEAK